MGDYVSHEELELALIKALDEAKEYTDVAEQRLREEWTDTVRHEVGRMDKHLDDQDSKINWVLGLIVTLLIALVGGLLYIALRHVA